MWHTRDNVDFALTPLALVGLVSPLGICPVGSFAVPITNEILHIWTVPGVPEPFGDLDDEWLDDHLAGL